MSKADWLRHIREAFGADLLTAALSRDAIQAHAEHCPECAKRRATKRANQARQDRAEAYRSCGLVKVRGALGGVYYE